MSTSAIDKPISRKRTYHVIETFENGKSTGFLAAIGKKAFLGYIHSRDIKFAHRFTAQEITNMPNIGYGHKDGQDNWNSLSLKNDEMYTNPIELVQRRVEIETTKSII